LPKFDIPRIVYHTITSSFFGIGIFASIRFNWVVGILVGITSLAGTPFFRTRGAAVTKRGPVPPFSPKKGASAPFGGGKGVPAKKLYQNVPTKISFGIGMVNTKKYRPIPTGKYRSDIQL
jgi:hypothetical protein